MRILVKVMAVGLLLLLLSLLLPSLYLRYELTNFLYRLQPAAATLSDGQLASTVNTFVGELSRGIIARDLTVKRKSKPVHLRLDYQEPVYLPLINPPIELFVLDQSVGAR